MRCRRPSRQARPWQRTPREPVATPGTARATAAMGPRRTARTYARRRSPAHGTPGPQPPWLPGTTPDNTVGATRGVNPQCPAGKQFQGTAFPETDPERRRVDWASGHRTRNCSLGLTQASAETDSAGISRAWCDRVAGDQPRWQPRRSRRHRVRKYLRMGPTTLVAKH